jgi:hypothetical protein
MMEGKEVLRTTISQLIEEMKQVDVKTDEEYHFIESWLRRNKESQALVTKAFEDERLETKAAYDNVLAEKAKYLAPLTESEKIARGKMSVYATAKEQARREEQARQDAIRRKEAEDKRLEEAQALQDAGKTEKADKLMEKAIRPAAVVVEPKIGKMREVWTVEVTDLKALLIAVANGEAEPGFVSVTTHALSGAAQRLKDKFSVPGVKAVQTFVPML